MHKRYRGLAAALLFVVLFAGGCKREDTVFSSGLDEIPITAESEYTKAEPADVTESDTEEPEMYVYVCGAVKNPGVYSIHADMRVFEAVEYAGGFAEDADVRWINQAEKVYDGQKLYIYTEEETSRMKQTEILSEQQNTVATDGKVNINQASRELLMTLPGIGESRADAIIQYRNDHGFFSSIEDIQKVPGIKQAVFSSIKGHITTDSY